MLRSFKRRTGVVAGACLVATLSACVSLNDAASCDRDCAIEALAAQMGAIANSTPITENGKTISAEAAWLNSVTDISIHSSFANDQGDAMLFGTAMGADGAPGIFGALATLTPGGEVTSLETLIALEGQASLTPPAFPVAPNPLFAEVLPADQRTPAARMVELAEIYFDGIETNSGEKLPVTADCERVENGVQTTHNPRFLNLDCNSLWPFVYIPGVRDRRYPIVDEARGVVLGIVMFDIPGGEYELSVYGETVSRKRDPRNLYLMEAFKIVDGEVRHIEATMRNLPYGTQLELPGQ